MEQSDSIQVQRQAKGHHKGWLGHWTHQDAQKNHKSLIKQWKALVLQGTEYKFKKAESFERFVLDMKLDTIFSFNCMIISLLGFLISFK